MIESNLMFCYVLLVLIWFSELPGINAIENQTASQLNNVLDKRDIKNGINNRTGRFFFDALFKIGSNFNDVLDYDDFDEDADYDLNSHVRTCDCGM